MPKVPLYKNRSTLTARRMVSKFVPAGQSVPWDNHIDDWSDDGSALRYIRSQEWGECHLLSEPPRIPTLQAWSPWVPAKREKPAHA